MISALSSHLSKVQAITEQNSIAIKTIASSPAAFSSDNAIRETNERLQTLKQVLTEREVVGDKIEQLQVQELMAGQRSMVDVLRELLSSIKAKEKAACAHVVIPPPRKFGR